MMQDELISRRLKFNLSRKDVSKLSGIDEDEYIKLENGNYRKMSPNDFNKLENVLKLNSKFKKNYVSPYSDLTFLKEVREKLGYSLPEAERKTGVRIMEMWRLEHARVLKISNDEFERIRKSYKLSKSANYDHLILENSNIEIEFINKEKFAIVVKERRKEKGLSQESLASICGIDHSLISKFETTRPSISMETALKLMTVLEFDNAEKSRYLVKK